LITQSSGLIKNYPHSAALAVYKLLVAAVQTRSAPFWTWLLNSPPKNWAVNSNEAVKRPHIIAVSYTTVATAYHFSWNAVGAVEFNTILKRKVLDAAGYRQQSAITQGDKALSRQLVLRTLLIRLRRILNRSCAE
jgi:hypothetical protein